MSVRVYLIKEQVVIDGQKTFVDAQIHTAIPEWKGQGPERIYEVVMTINAHSQRYAKQLLAERVATEPHLHWAWPYVERNSTEATVARRIELNHTESMIRACIA